MTVFLFHHQCIGVDSGLDFILEEERCKCSTFFLEEIKCPLKTKPTLKHVVPHLVTRSAFMWNIIDNNILLMSMSSSCPKVSPSNPPSTCPDLRRWCHSTPLTNSCNHSGNCVEWHAVDWLAHWHKCTTVLMNLKTENWNEKEDEREMLSHHKWKTECGQSLQVSGHQLLGWETLVSSPCQRQFVQEQALLQVTRHWCLEYAQLQGFLEAQALCPRTLCTTSHWPWKSAWSHSTYPQSKWHCHCHTSCKCGGKVFHQKRQNRGCFQVGSCTLCWVPWGMRTRGWMWLLRWCVEGWVEQRKEHEPSSRCEGWADGRVLPCISLGTVFIS